MSVAPARTNRQLYAPDNPLTGIDFDKKVALLEEIDAYTFAGQIVSVRSAPPFSAVGSLLKLFALMATALGTSVLWFA